MLKLSDCHCTELPHCLKIWDLWDFHHNMGQIKNLWDVAGLIIGSKGHIRDEGFHNASCKNIFLYEIHCYIMPKQTCTKVFIKLLTNCTGINICCKTLNEVHQCLRGVLVYLVTGDLKNKNVVILFNLLENFLKLVGSF